MSYLVCASQRSGTELLCRGLAATGVAGRPQEYFLAEDPAKLPDWGFWEEGPYAAGHDVGGRESYLALVYRLGTTPNGVFGAKIHWNCLRWALAKFAELPRFAGLDRVAILRTAFPDLRVIDVKRRDRVRQAVSWARMAQDGRWVDPVGEPEPLWPPPAGPPRYDYELIAALEALIAESETAWRQLYHELGLTPYQVVYEELSSPGGYEQAIGGVLAHLGLGDYQGTIPAPRTRRQSNDLNEAWVAAYLADKAARAAH
ncbi:MAG TPA: Stf0 family sulfotransferase [Trebonia sp.]